MLMITSALHEVRSCSKKGKNLIDAVVFEGGNGIGIGIAIVLHQSVHHGSSTKLGRAPLRVSTTTQPGLCILKLTCGSYTAIPIPNASV